MSVPNQSDGLRNDPIELENRTSALRNVSAAIVGNALEWFDILSYATFVSFIAMEFFPRNTPTISTMTALGVFGVSFVARPLGAIVLGWFADRAGRRKTLALTSGLMFLGTAIIAFLPGYSQIGIAAPGLLVIARLIQGFSAGGEFGSATAYLAEQSPQRRGFFSSWQFASQGLGLLLAGLLGAGLSSALSYNAMAKWGWRVPFYFGMLVGPVAYFIRYYVDESPGFIAVKRAKSTKREPEFSLHLLKRVLAGIGLVLVGTVTAYFLAYMPAYAHDRLGVHFQVGMWATTCASLTLIIFTPIAGTVGDRVGPMKVALACCTALMLAPLVLFAILVGHPTPFPTLATQFLLALLLSGYLGAMGALLSGLFPARHRSLGLSLSYNVAVMTAGGFAPLIFATLAAFVGNKAPSYYLAAAAFLSLVSLLIVRRSNWLNNP